MLYPRHCPLYPAAQQTFLTAPLSLCFFQNSLDMLRKIHYSIDTQQIGALLYEVVLSSSCYHTHRYCRRCVYPLHRFDGFDGAPCKRGRSISRNDGNVASHPNVWFLAIGIFFTVFAVKASKADQFSAKERQEALQREQSALSQRFRQTLAAVPFFTQTEPSITLPAFEMIVGTSVDDRQMNLSESRPGDPLSVIHAPTAKYPNAAKIVNDRTEKILGTVNIDTEKTLLSKFGNGYSLHGSLKEVYSTPAGSTGTIEILSKTE